MVYQERNTWASLIVSVIGVAVYVVLVLQVADGGPLTDVDWWPIMLWTILGAIAATILVSIVWGIVAGLRDPEGASTSDLRDRDISRMGERVGQAFLVLGGLAVIVLCAFEADWFWIANAMFFAFALSNAVGAIARVVAYRRGLV